MQIFCCNCDCLIEARLAYGTEVYPRRKDLATIPFWKCDRCGQHVSCHHRHHDESKRLDPMGVIASPEIKSARQHLHRIIDPIWRQKRMKRKKLYDRIARKLGWRVFHTAEIRTLSDARKAWKAVKEIEKDLAQNSCAR